MERRRRDGLDRHGCRVSEAEAQGDPVDVINQWITHVVIAMLIELGKGA